jgi:hypothetical protein
VTVRNKTAAKRLVCYNNTNSFSSGLNSSSDTYSKYLLRYNDFFTCYKYLQIVISTLFIKQCKIKAN